LYHVPETDSPTVVEQFMPVTEGVILPTGFVWRRVGGETQLVAYSPSAESIMLIPISADLQRSCGGNPSPLCIKMWEAENRTTACKTSEEGSTTYDLQSNRYINLKQKIS